MNFSLCANMSVFAQTVTNDKGSHLWLRRRKWLNCKWLLSLAYDLKKSIQIIQYEMCGQDANKAQSDAECFLGIKASHWMLYFMYIGRARPCFNCFKEVIHECLVKVYLFQSIARPSTLSSRVRWFWIISRITNISVSRLILAELIITWIHHLVLFFTIHFHTLPCYTAM